MDRLEAISVLLAAIDAGSMSAGARRLDMPLSTVSRKIAELEAYLKTRLLIRTTRQISLTDAGQSYVATCRLILEQLGEAERSATGEYTAPRGDLIITAPVVFGRLHIVPLVAEFLALYPEIDIRLILADRVVHLTEERVDVALRIGELPDSSLVATRVGEIRRVTCASPSYLAAHGTPVHPRDLVSHQCITFEGLWSPKLWAYSTGKSMTSVPVHSRFVVTTAEAAIDAAVLGTGITNVLSYQIAKAVDNNELKIVLEKFEPVPWPVSLVHAGQTPLPLKLRAFLDFVTPRLRTRISPGTSGRSRSSN